jgi:transposase InsO family protein
MGPFPKSEGCKYILVVIDYVSKWVESLPCRAVDAMHSKKMFHEIIFPRYGVARIVISDGGSQFIDQTFQKALSKDGLDHRIATPYYPQTSGQTETSNKQIKNILQKTESNGQKLEEQADVVSGFKSFIEAPRLVWKCGTCRSDSPEGPEKATRGGGGEWEPIKIPRRELDLYPKINPNVLSSNSTKTD